MRLTDHLAAAPPPPPPPGADVSVVILDQTAGGRRSPLLLTQLHLSLRHSSAPLGLSPQPCSFPIHPSHLALAHMMTRFYDDWRQSHKVRVLVSKSALILASTPTLFFIIMKQSWCTRECTS